MSLTNAYHLHPKMGADFGGVTQQCHGNEMQLQVGPAHRGVVVMRCSVSPHTALRPVVCVLIFLLLLCGSHPPLWLSLMFCPIYAIVFILIMRDNI